MAKRTSHRKADSSRVYKASDVHKRRVDRPSRSGSVFRSTPDVNAPEGPKRDTSRTQFVNASDAPVEPVAAEPAVEMPSTPMPAVDAPAQEAPVEAAPVKRKPTPRKRADLSSKMQPVVQPAADVSEGAAAEQAEGEFAGERTEEEARSQAIKRIQAAASQLKRSKLRTGLTVAAVVVIVVVLIGGLLYWNRCMRHDDHADMQGTWYVAGSVVPITIDENEMHFTDDVSYAYIVDPAEKTIDVSLGLMEGQSYYRFSNDRQYLVIAKDDSEAAQSVASQGPMRLIDDFASLFGIENFEMPEGDGLVVLERKPSPLSVIYEREAQEVVAVKAAAEERARQEEELAAKRAEEEAAAAELAAAGAEAAAAAAQAEAERAALEEAGIA